MAASDLAIARYECLGTGINVDWCKTTPGITWAKHWAKYGLSVPMIFKERGFDHVRIRIKDDATPELLEHLDNLISQCCACSLQPIVAYQAKEFKLNPYHTSTRKKVVDWWSAIAEKLDRYAARVSFNFVIETTDTVKSSPLALNTLYQEINDAIRPMCGRRLHIICPTGICAPEALHLLEIPTRGARTDRNFIAESHWYAAGPQPSGPKSWGNGEEGTPTAEEVQRLRDKAELAAKWAHDNSTPVYMGAWMNGDFDNAVVAGNQYHDGGPMSLNFSVEQRKDFTRHMKRALSKNGLRAHAVNSDTKYYDRTTNHWYETQSGILNTLFLDLDD